jgi:DNA-binding MarR family transcriptional regulator
VLRVLTDAQVQVLAALNDYLEIHGKLGLDHATKELQDILKDLEIPDDEVYQAIGDLKEQGLIEGQGSYGVRYPTIVLRVTARGRQELP